MYNQKPNIFLSIEIYINGKWVDVASYPLTKVCVLLGRKKSLLKPESGDILIDQKICHSSICQKISSVHLTFYRRSETEKDSGSFSYNSGSIKGYAVRDGYNGQPSTNGTYLNGKPLKEKVNLKDKDVLQIASEVRVIYHQPEKKSSVSNDLEDTLAEQVIYQSESK